MGRQVHAPAVVAVGPAAHELAVEPDGCVGHGPIHVEVERLARVTGRDVEGPAVPDRPQVCRRPMPPRGNQWTGRACGGPVVRQAHGLPGTVIEVGASRPGFEPADRQAGVALLAGIADEGFAVGGIQGLSTPSRDFTCTRPHRAAHRPPLPSADCLTSGARREIKAAAAGSGVTLRKRQPVSKPGCARAGDSGWSGAWRWASQSGCIAAAVAQQAIGGTDVSVSKLNA